MTKSEGLAVSQYKVHVNAKYAKYFLHTIANWYTAITDVHGPQ